MLLLDNECDLMLSAESSVANIVLQIQVHDAFEALIAQTRRLCVFCSSEKCVAFLQAIISNAYLLPIQCFWSSKESALEKLMGHLMDSEAVCNIDFVGDTPPGAHEDPLASLFVGAQKTTLMIHFVFFEVDTQVPVSFFAE